MRGEYLDFDTVDLDAPDGRDHRAKSPESQTPEQAEWCQRSEREQWFLGSLRRFASRAKEEAITRGEARAWTRARQVEFYRRHMDLFRRNLILAEQRSERGGDPDPPCKDWERRLAGVMDPATVSLLRGMFEASRTDWARAYPYLASPTAPCQCLACLADRGERPPGFRKVPGTHLVETTEDFFT